MRDEYEETQEQHRKALEILKDENAPKFMIEFLEMDCALLEVVKLFNHGMLGISLPDKYAEEFKQFRQKLLRIYAEEMK